MTRTDYFTTQLLPGEIAPSLDDLYHEYVRELSEYNPEFPTIEDLERMWKWCPISPTCVEIKADRGLALMGKYQHSDKELHRTPTGWMTITEWVESNWESMDGSIEDIWNVMFQQCIFFGRSVAEIIPTKEQEGFGKQWRLQGLKVLPPSKYEFAGFGGNWDRVIYKGSEGPRPIPRSKLLHIYIPDIGNPLDPRGHGQGIRAFPFWKARSLAHKNRGLTLKRHATGTWLLKGDDEHTVTKVDSNGNPVRRIDGTLDTEPAIYKVVREVRKSEDGSVIGLSKKIDAQFFASTSAGGMGQDFQVALDDYKANILWAFGIPKTLFDEGSATLGQAGLNYGHRLIFDTQISKLVTKLRNQMLEQVIKRLLVGNFGARYKANLGSFGHESFVAPEMKGTIVSNVTQATMSGLLDANDIEVQNVVRQACGVSTISAEEFDRKQVQKLLQEAEAKQQEQEQEQESEGVGEAEYQGLPAIARFNHPKIVRRIA